MAKAAAQLRIRQPTVSEIVSNLEHMFGVRLFDRGPRGVELTNFGGALLKRSVAMFDELKQSVRDIDFLVDPTAGELRIGCPESILLILAPMMEVFCRRHPRVVVNIDQADNRTLALPALRNREIDLVLGHFGTSTPNDRLADDLHLDVLFDDPVVVAAGMRSRLANRRKLDLADLVEEPWILGTPGSWPNKILSEAFQARGLGAPKISLMTISMQLRATMVASGNFITTFPRSVMQVQADRWKLKLLPVELPARPWPLAVVTLKDRTLSPVVALFIRHVREFTRSMGSRQEHQARKPRTAVC
jgi:DNA-binding transcriptional LysR family regulator